MSPRSLRGILQTVDVHPEQRLVQQTMNLFVNSGIMISIPYQFLTATKEAGRKIMVRYEICFVADDEQ
jgi:hypothetical protein